MNTAEERQKERERKTVETAIVNRQSDDGDMRTFIVRCVYRECMQRCECMLNQFVTEIQRIHLILYAFFTVHSFFLIFVLAVLMFERFCFHLFKHTSTRPAEQVEQLAKLW